MHEKKPLFLTFFFIFYTGDSDKKENRYIWRIWYYLYKITNSYIFHSGDEFHFHMYSILYLNNAGIQNSLHIWGNHQKLDPKMFLQCNQSYVCIVWWWEYFWIKYSNPCVRRSESVQIKGRVLIWASLPSSRQDFSWSPHLSMKMIAMFFQYKGTFHWCRLRFCYSDKGKFIFACSNYQSFSDKWVCLLVMKEPG